MNIIKKFSVIAASTLAFAVSSCRDDLDRFNDFKEHNPKATRADFIKEEMSGFSDEKPYYDVGREHIQRKERVYGYHYGYSVRKGKFCRHLGFYKKNRKNTPEENRQDALAYAKRVAVKDSIDADYQRYNSTLPTAKAIITALATTKEFNHVADKDDNMDSLDIEGFTNNANALAHACAQNNNKLVMVKAASDDFPDKKLYTEAYIRTLRRAQRTRNSTIRVRVRA